MKKEKKMKIVKPEVKLVKKEKLNVEVEAKKLAKQGLNVKEVAKILNIDKYQASKLIKKLEEK